MELQTLTAASSSTSKINENYAKINIEPICVVSSSTSNIHLNDVKADAEQKPGPLQILTATNSSNSNFHLNDENNDIKQISAPLQIITASSSTNSNIQINNLKSNNINPTPVSLQTKPVPNTSKIPLHLNDQRINSNPTPVSLQTKPVPSTSKIPRGQKKSRRSPESREFIIICSKSDTLNLKGCLRRDSTYDALPENQLTNAKNKRGIRFNDWLNKVKLI